MNPVERAIRRADAMQQRHTPTAFAIGVVKKYGDDNGGVLAGDLAYSAFVSIFPLLLILVTILGLAASLNPSFRTDVLNAVAGQVPLIGHQLTGNVHQHVEVTFHDREPGTQTPARTPQTPEEVAPPADVRVPGQRGAGSAGDRAERDGELA